MLKWRIGYTAANATAAPATQTPPRSRGTRRPTYTYNERTNRLGQLTIIAM